MEIFLIILMMIVIGAAIGGVTNSLAIKMLFRPYVPKYIGGWKIPLTPGLIPKRREELAKQLGKMVVEHLLTPEGIKKKLGQAEFQQQLTTWIQEEVNRLLKQNISLQETLAKIGINMNEEDIQNKVARFAEVHYEQFMEESRKKKIKELVSSDWADATEKRLEVVATYIQNQLIIYVNSDQTKRKIGEIIESYLEGKGFFGNMISSFLGNEGLTDKVHPVLVEYIDSEDAKELIHQMLINEYNRLFEQHLSTIENKLAIQSLGQTIGKVVSNALPIRTWLNKSIQDWIEAYKPQLINHILPTFSIKIVDVVISRVDSMMQNLKLEEIVEKEVESFPIERVEQLVLSISRREFKLITYLGALLGGIIGLVQGIIVVLIG